MSNTGQITQTDKKNQRKIQSPVAESPGSSANLMPEIGPAFNGPTVEAQADMLNRLPTVQGQTVAKKIGETQGNRHLQRVMTSLKDTPVQTKLSVSEPGDEYELEADQVAEQVMKMPAPATPPPPPTDGDDGAGEDPRNHNRPASLNRYVQRTAAMRSSDGIGGNEVDAGVESRIQNMQRGGTPMPQTERDFFESRMGVDLGNVKIHNDSEAAATSEKLNAQAYTVGSNIAFGAGKYAPGTTAGRRLMAHELTHVVQQGGAGELQRKPILQREEDAPAEGEAPSPEEQAAAEAAAAAAEAAAQGAHQQAVTDTNTEQTEASSEEQAGIAPAQEAAASQAEGPVSNEEEDARAAAQQAAAQQAQAAEEAARAVAQAQAQAATEQSAQAAAQQAAENAATQAAAEQAGPEAGGSGAGAQAAAADAATIAAQQAVETAFSESESPADAAPRSPEEDEAYQAVTEASATTAEEQQTHGEAQGEADAAQNAVETPANELQATAESNQVNTMEGAETPAFDAAAFKAALMARIAELTPSTIEGADEFKEDGTMDDVRGGLVDDVQAQQDTSATPLTEASAAAPDTGSVTPRTATPLAEQDAGEVPGDIGAEGAAPQARSESEFETPLADSSAALDQQMADAEITEEQLSNSNEPEFLTALDAKDEAQTEAAESPATYRQDEQDIITGAEEDAVAAAQESLQGMYDERASLLDNVGNDQQQAMQEDVQAREKIAADITLIYEQTKTEVESILSGLDSEVTSIFDAGAEAAKTAFEDYVDSKMEAYKQKRYGGWLGWARWLRDKLMGMPGDVNSIYQEGRDLYINEMDAVIDNIAAVISTTLAEAKAAVAEGKQQVQDYVGQLPDDLRAVGEEAATAIQGQFDSLEQTIDNKQTELVNTLAQKYNENLEAIDARIEELKAQNRGLIDAAIDALGGVIKTILELKDLLLSTLQRAADAVMMILKDPIGFLGNLISAVKQGFMNFVDNIGTHLQTGFIEWLTGNLSEAGITLPETWDAKGIFGLVMQILGLTWENIRSRAVGIFGEGVVSALETGFEIFVVIRDEGLPGLWKWIQDKLTDIKEQVFDGIKEMLISEVIEAGIQWLIGILGGPAGAFIKAAKAIYDIIVWFVNNAERIMALVNSIIDSVTAIAAGDLAGAAQFVEQSLARFVPTVIGFLASLIGLGDLGAKVRKIIDKIQEPINAGIDYVLNLIKGFVMKIAKMLGFGGEGKEGGQIGKDVTFSAAEESHTLSVTKQGELNLDDTALSGKLGEIGSKIGEMEGDEKGEAQGLHSQAQGMESNASAKAASLAQRMQAVKKLGDEESLAADQQALEADEDALAGVLTQLLEKAGGKDGNVEEALAAIDTEEQKFLEEGAIEFEEAEQVAATIKSQFSIFQSLTVVDGGDKWNYEYVVQREVKEGERKEGAYGSYMVAGGNIQGSFSHADWTWDSYPSQTTTRHPANDEFGDHNGRVPDLTGPYELTGATTPGSPHVDSWRDEVGAKKNVYKRNLEQIRDGNPTRPKQAVLEYLGVAGNSRWQQKSNDRVVEDGAKLLTEREINGTSYSLSYDEIYLVGWSEHHIQPVSFDGNETDPGNLIFLKDTEHQPFTGWWNSRMAALKRSFGTGGRSRS